MMLRSRYGLFVCGLILCIPLLLAGCGSQSESESKSGQDRTVALRLPDFTRIVKAVRPAVVNISALPSKPAGADGESLEDWFKRFFGSQSPQGMPRFVPHPSLGSGFIISSDGYILTNRHVVRGAGRIVVKLANRQQLIAEVVGVDKYTDVALLKVDAHDLPTVTIGDPDALQVGAWVLAIGSPFGFEASVTAGIVSAKGRTLASEQYVPFIQTDVAINPGNSGGPLFNLSGEVVGINSQIYSRTGGYQGVSFAIPIDIAMHVAQQLKADGNVARGWLGVQIQNVSRALAQSFGLERPRGALVSRVFPDSPAAGVGVHPGDIILTFNGHKVPSAGALPPMVARLSPGENVHMTLLRHGDKEQFEIEIGALPADLAALGDADPAQHNDAPQRVHTLGLTLEALTPEQRQRLGVGDNGVRVTAISAGAGAEAGLRVGDIILAVGKHWVDAPAQFVRRIEQASGPVALLVWRDGARLYLALQPTAAKND